MNSHALFKDLTSKSIPNIDYKAYSVARWKYYAWGFIILIVISLIVFLATR